MNDYVGLINRLFAVGKPIYDLKVNLTNNEIMFDTFYWVS